MYKSDNAFTIWIVGGNPPYNWVVEDDELGEISVKTDPQLLAGQLMLTIAGGAVMVKGLIEPEDAHRAINNLIDSWV